MPGLPACLHACLHACLPACLPVRLPARLPAGLQLQYVCLPACRATKHARLPAGNEGYGLRTNVKRACTGMVQIEMAAAPGSGAAAGGPHRILVDSLNVSVATGILLHHLVSSARFSAAEAPAPGGVGAGEAAQSASGVEAGEGVAAAEVAGAVAAAESVAKAAAVPGDGA
jgi:hypothetical protein